MATPRTAPGGASTVCLGSDSASWDTDSSAHGRGSAEAVAAASARAPRCEVGGHDSIKFGASDDAVRPATARQACGGTSTVVLGDDSAEWTTNSSAHGVGGTEAAALAMPRVCPAPGGVDSVVLGGGGPDSAAEKPRSERVATGGPTTILLGSHQAEWTTNSSTHGVGCAEATSAAPLSARPSPGGHDSIDFGHRPSNPTAQELLARRPADGHSTVVLGTDASEWGTNSSVHGVGSAEAVATASARERTAPGGVDSIEFGREAALASKEELLARASVGGTDSVGRLAEASCPASSAEELLARQAVGGKDSIQFGASTAAAASDPHRASNGGGGQTSVILGVDPSDWGTSSSSHGIGSAEAVASAEPRVRTAVGGLDSVSFGQAGDKAASAQELLARKATAAGPSSVVLGSDGADWFTNSSVNGVGSAEAVAAAEPRVRTAPGGADTVDLGNADLAATPVEELLTRPAVGGDDHVDFANKGDSGLPAQELLTRPAVAGPTSVVLGADLAEWATNSQAVGVGSAEAVAVAAVSARGVRPPIGGTDSVSLGGEAPAFKPGFAHPTGAATIVLGADPAEWSADSHALGAGSAEAVAAAEQRVRQVPGGKDSIDFAKDHGNVASTLTAEELLARPSPGGADCIDLTSGAQAAQLAEPQTSRAGPKLSTRGTGGASTVVLGTYVEPDQASRAPRAVSQRTLAPAAETPRSGRVAPGGNSSFSLAHDEGVARESVSSNCFADGSNQNAGNVLTARSTTRLHHAPGGYSNLSLAHQGSQEPASGPAVLGEATRTVSSNAFANGSSQNMGNVITDRSSTRLHQAPGGTSTICLGDENVDSSNINISTDKITAEHAKLEAPDVPAAGARPIILG